MHVNLYISMERKLLLKLSWQGRFCAIWATFIWKISSLRANRWEVSFPAIWAAFIYKIFSLRANRWWRGAIIVFHACESLYITGKEIIAKIAKIVLGRAILCNLSSFYLTNFLAPRQPMVARSDDSVPCILFFIQLYITGKRNYCYIFMGRAILCNPKQH